MKCKMCKKGTYKEMSLYDDWDGTLSCNKCGHQYKSPESIKSITVFPINRDDDNPFLYGKDELYSAVFMLDTKFSLVGRGKNKKEALESLNKLLNQEFVTIDFKRKLYKSGLDKIKTLIKNENE